jgi:hypothetical protein
MKKILWILLVFIFQLSAFNSVWAQRFDAKLFVGLNLCQVDGDDAGKFNHPGLRAGVGSSFALGESESPWRFVVELAYAQKGSHIEHNNGEISLQYVEVPLMLSYNLIEGRLRFAAGVAPAVLVGAKVTFNNVDDPAQAANYKRMDWMPFTAEVSYRFTNHFVAEARYQNSLLSVYDGPGPYRIWTSNHGAFNRLLSVGIAYQF